MAYSFLVQYNPHQPWKWDEMRIEDVIHIYNGVPDLPIDLEAIREWLEHASHGRILRVGRDRILAVDFQDK